MSFQIFNNATHPDKFFQYFPEILYWRKEDVICSKYGGATNVFRFKGILSNGTLVLKTPEGGSAPVEIYFAALWTDSSPSEVIHGSVYGSQHIPPTNPPYGLTIHQVRAVTSQLTNNSLKERRALLEENRVSLEISNSPIDRLRKENICPI